jgi:hypothetical protein
LYFFGQIVPPARQQVLIVRADPAKCAQKARFSNGRMSNRDAIARIAYSRREAPYVPTHEGTNTFQFQERYREIQMKYLVAWGLGVPGVLIVIWFLMSHH